MFKCVTQSPIPSDFYSDPVQFLMCLWFCLNVNLVLISFDLKMTSTPSFNPVVLHPGPGGPLALHVLDVSPLSYTPNLTHQLSRLTKQAP